VAQADLSSLHVCIPVRSASGGKSRLGGALDPEERETLTLGMLQQTLDVLRSWERAAVVHLVTPDASLIPWTRARGIRPILQPTAGLNEGLRLARAAAVEAGATALLLLPGDLPFVAREPLDRLLDAADATLAAGHGQPIVVIVPADARGGTNALLLSPPDVIEPAFEVDSFERHLRLASRAGASVQVVVEPSLSFDLDTPDDLERLETTHLERLVTLGARGGPEPGRPAADEPGKPATDQSGSAGIRAVPIPTEPGRFPEVRPGDDLAAMIADAWRAAARRKPNLAPASTDVLVVTQKIVSKAEGRIVDLRTVEPRPEARAFAERFDRDPRQVEVVLREAAEILRMERGLVIARTHHGFVCANAGVDASNVSDPDTVTLLPMDPDASARELRRRLGELLGVTPAIVISDSFGRPWRWGIVDVALGVAGFEPLDDQRGKPDTAGRTMRSTVVAVADEIASAAELAAGKTSGQPVVLVRGVRLPPGDGSVHSAVVMPAEMDLFP